MEGRKENEERCERQELHRGRLMVWKKGRRHLSCLMDICVNEWAMKTSEDVLIVIL
jgi:hypothetical protein